MRISVGPLPEEGEQLTIRTCTVTSRPRGPLGKRITAPLDARRACNARRSVRLRPSPPRTGLMAAVLSAADSKQRDAAAARARLLAAAVNVISETISEICFVSFSYMFYFPSAICHKQSLSPWSFQKFHGLKVE